MIRGQTKSGFEFEIDEEVLDNWEILEVIDELEEKPNLIVRLSKMLLEDEQYKKLKKHCTVNGKVVMTAMVNEVTEILNKNQETKN